MLNVTISGSADVLFCDRGSSSVTPCSLSRSLVLANHITVLQVIDDYLDTLGDIPQTELGPRCSCFAHFTP